MMRRPSENRADGSSAAQVSTHAESALRAVRVLLAVLALFVIVGYRPIPAPSWTSTAATGAAIVLVAATANLVSIRLRQTLPWLLLAQLLDIFAIVGLAAVLDGPLREETWALLLIPIVSASVRFGAAASLATWAIGCVAYQAAAWQGILTGLDTAGMLIRAPGTLLAIALTVGLLARWMREGWEIQNELTEQSMRRERRLAVIESTSRGLAELSSIQALELCAVQSVALGFDAATVHFPSETAPRIAVGNCEIVAQTHEHSPPNDISNATAKLLATTWTSGDAVVVHSVAVVEPNTGASITAWSTTPVEADQAQALATLVAHTTGAVTAASIRARLEDAAARDPLTGLANRRTFDAALETAAAGPEPVALAFIDVDDFKMLNDKHGHLVGDDMLVIIARRIESAISDGDLAARFGGDEFVVLMPGKRGDEATQVAQAIIAAMSDPISIGLTSVTIGVSVGVSAGQTPMSPPELLQAADQAVYQAKSIKVSRSHRSTAVATATTS